MSNAAKTPIAPLQYGKLKLQTNVLYAPLAGCSDFAFRKMSARFHPGIIFCEMVKMDALIRHDAGTYHLLDFSPDMHPIGGQLCGSKPEIAAAAAEIIEDLGFDVIDFNCGCPVDKVTKDGSGSGMLKNPELIGDIIANMVAKVKIPVTVKIRSGWDDKAIIVEDIVRIAEKSGAKAITVHGRTREQGYKGPANWDWIKRAKAAATHIQVIGNGDIFSAQDALRMFDYTGCDGVLVARGTLGQPWIAEDIHHLASGSESVVRTPEMKRTALLEHFEYMQEYLPERKVVIDMRRVGCWYFTKAKGTRSFREAISKAATVAEIHDLIMQLPVDEDEPDGQEGSVPDISQ